MEPERVWSVSQAGGVAFRERTPTGALTKALDLIRGGATGVCIIEPSGRYVYPSQFDKLDAWLSPGHLSEDLVA
jgi:hypothetical protein